MKHKLITIFAVLTFTISFSACDKKDDIKSVSFEELGLSCHPIHDKGRIIQNEEEFIAMVKENIYSDSELLCCDTISMPVDFSQSIIIGKQITVIYSDEVSKHVYMDKQNKKIVFDISQKTEYFDTQIVSFTFVGSGGFAISGDPLGVVRGSYDVVDSDDDISSLSLRDDVYWIAIPIPPEGYDIEIKYSIIQE